MPVTVNINRRSLCHRGSQGVSRATLPDVCKTPGNGIPLPYPNVAFSRDLVQGTKSITADGRKMCAKYGSRFKKSTGDQPGRLGGIISGVTAKEATWITFSFDVKLEGRGACRLSDKMWHNRGNTVNAAGLNQRMLRSIRDTDACECDRRVRAPFANASAAQKAAKSCADLGLEWQACMEREVRRRVQRTGRRLDGERGYNKWSGRAETDTRSRTERWNEVRNREAEAVRRRADLARTQNERARQRARMPRAPRGGGRGAAAAQLGELLGEVLVNWLEAGPIRDFEGATNQMRSRLLQVLWPDAAIRGANGAIENILEFKFSCPEGFQAPNGISTGQSRNTMDARQRQNYERLLDRMRRTDPNSVAGAASVEEIGNLNCR
ncbi:MAG: DUF4150 domain-containing protein [Gemmatimonadaceae bacterium]|jgi:hypothetical protein|nr:DUF4150 domain-containing protein [Gemmatimonadaceae bacterium]